MVSPAAWQGSRDGCVARRAKIPLPGRGEMCYTGGQWCPRAEGGVAQWLEQRFFKPWVGGSSPPALTRTPSSSQVQDTGFSSLEHGFKSRWGRHLPVWKPRWGHPLHLTRRCSWAILQADGRRKGTGRRLRSDHDTERSVPPGGTLAAQASARTLRWGHQQPRGCQMRRGNCGIPPPTPGVVGESGPHGRDSSAHLPPRGRMLRSFVPVGSPAISACHPPSASPPLRERRPPVQCRPSRSLLPHQVPISTSKARASLRPASVGLGTH